MNLCRFRLNTSIRNYANLKTKDQNGHVLDSKETITYIFLSNNEIRFSKEDGGLRWRKCPFG